MSHKTKSFCRLHRHIITQRLYDEEKAEFAERLQELEDKDIAMETVLTFVIMANNFDESSEYVRRVVVKSLDGIDLYPKARQLLTFLVVPTYKYYLYLISSIRNTKYCFIFMNELLMTQNFNRLKSSSNEDN